MRTDTNLARDSFRFSSHWDENAVSGVRSPEIDRRLRGGRLEDGKFVAHSLSGHERNHLFLNAGGAAFEDVSRLSGLDTPADSRCTVLLDYDRDGWQDIAVVNANSPLLNLYRNEVALAGGDRRRMIALRFVGGNRSAAPSPFAPRDGYGAVATISLGDLTLEREHRCGDGYAAQNSATMIVGIGERDTVPLVAVRWPSGLVQEARQVAAGSLLTVYEDLSESPSGAPFVIAPYRVAAEPGAANVAARSTAPALGRFALRDRETPRSATPPTLRVYTTMATWCAACKRNLPRLERLRAALPEAAVELIGVPVDEKDDAEKLREYVERWRPAYRLLADLPATERGAVQRIVTALTGSDALPATIVTDSDDDVVRASAGVPSLSELRRLLEARAPAAER